MHTTQTLEERYRLVRDRVAAAAHRSGRSAEDVFIVAVTKYAELDDILELMSLGHMDFGESRVPQMIDRAHAIDELLADGDAFDARLRAIRRARSLAGEDGAGGSAGGVVSEGRASGAGHPDGEGSDGRSADSGDAGTGSGSGRVVGGIVGGIDIGPGSGIGRSAPRVRESSEPAPSARREEASRPSPRWHMIGQLQRNKVKKLLDVTRLVHSVDSLRLIEEIHSWAYKKDREVEVLLQVNCSGESQKGGCAPAAAMHLAETIDSMVHLRLRGLMTMAALSDDPDESRSAFELGRELFDDIKARGIGEGRFNLLSMGMSGDFEVGIECGANVVRIGSAIFGERELGDEDEGGDGGEDTE
ncbi:MAG: YggS family pyridoxal phosphate-dependent enzyme [Phycisphaerales bacterium]